MTSEEVDSCIDPIVAASRDYGPVEQVVRMRSTAAIGGVPAVAKEYAYVIELEETKQALLDNSRYNLLRGILTKRGWIERGGLC